MFQKMLIAYDGSFGADRALLAAFELARVFQTNLQVLTVAGHVPQFAGTIDEIEEESAFSHPAAQEHLARALKRAQEAGVPLSGEVRAGHTIRTLLDYASEGQFDLVVVGHSGSQKWGDLPGHDSERVSCNAHCAVLIVR